MNTQSEGIEMLADADFIPIEAIDDIWSLAPRAMDVLRYFGERGFIAFRIDTMETSIGVSWATLVGFADGELRLLAIDRNGVTLSTARFDESPIGWAWLASAVKS